jgi:hypothetical protein
MEQQSRRGRREGRRRSAAAAVAATHSSPFLRGLGCFVFDNTQQTAFSSHACTSGARCRLAGPFPPGVTTRTSKLDGFAASLQCSRYHHVDPPNVRHGGEWPLSPHVFFLPPHDAAGAARQTDRCLCAPFDRQATMLGVPPAAIPRAATGSYVAGGGRRSAASCNVDRLRCCF